MTDLEYIRSQLPPSELLTQLAEESTELAQAALKLRRALVGVNPARVNRIDAYAALLEEISDVELSLMVCGVPRDEHEKAIVNQIVEEKLKRWRCALEEREVSHEAKADDKAGNGCRHSQE